MKKFFKEFKEFALKSNVMALAVGVIIGGAFQGVVTSLTDNILSPIIGIFAGSNFDSLILTAFGVTIKYGAFLTSLVDFIIMAFVVFIMIKIMAGIMSIGKKKKDEEKAPEARLCPYCKTELHAEATRCPACTSELETEAV